MMSHIEMEYAKTLRDLAEARAEIVRLKGEAQYGATFVQRAIDAERELAELREELNDKRKFCYAVEQALDGLKGDYVEIIVALRKEWVGLTDADFEKEKFVDYNFMSGASFAEAKLREKNT